MKLRIKALLNVLKLLPVFLLFAAYWVIAWSVSVMFVAVFPERIFPQGRTGNRLVEIITAPLETLTHRPAVAPDVHNAQN